MDVLRPNRSPDALDLTRLDAGPLDDPRSVAGALFAAVSQPVALVDAEEGRAVYVAANPAYLSMVGLAGEDVVGRSVGDLFPGAPAAEATRRILDAVRSGEVRTSHDVIATPRGSRSIESSLVPVGPGGRVLLVLRDRTDVDRVAAALASSEQRFATLADASPTGIFALDESGRCTYTNARLQDIAGRSVGELAGLGWERALHPDDREAFVEYQRVTAGGRSDPMRVRLLRPDGETRWVEVRTAALPDPRGHVTGFVGTADDVTERMRARQVADELAAILEETTDLVAISGPDGHVSWMNGAARAFHHLDAGDDLAVPVPDLYPEWARRKYEREIFPALERWGRWSGDVVMTSLGDGTPRHVHQSIVAHRGHDGRVQAYSSVAREIPDGADSEAQMARQLLHDALTGLPARPLFMDRLDQALARSARQGGTVAVLYADLDRFKVVNDSLGYDAGDRILTAVAHRLRGVLRPSDSIARMGGDEFVVLCEDAPRQGVDIAERMGEVMTAPFVLEGGEVHVTASIGVAVAEPSTESTPETLLRDAAAAMTRAKERGRARYDVADERLRAHVTARIETETALRRALDQDDFVVHYQPLVSLDNGRIVAVEALVRWRHPERGLLPPADFVPVAEEAGLIVALGEQVLRNACRQVAGWRRRGVSSPGLWVNLSARQLNHLDLLPTLESALEDAGLEPDRLGLEITESVLMEEAPSTLAALAELKRLGVGVAIDDFGTGYSSLSYLKRFPLTTLKVDRSFVEGLGHQPEDAAIVRAQVAMAHALGLSVIAEGVETAPQLELLRAMGCDFAQGYLFAPPLTGEELEDVLARRPRW